MWTGESRQIPPKFSFWGYLNGVKKFTLREQWCGFFLLFFCALRDWSRTLIENGEANRISRKGIELPAPLYSTRWNQCGRLRIRYEKLKLTPRLSRGLPQQRSDVILVSVIVINGWSFSNQKRAGRNCACYSGCTRGEISGKSGGVLRGKRPT